MKAIAKQIRRALNQSGLACTCTETASIDEALKACDKQDFDAAIVDYRLPGADGLAGITALHGRFPWMAIIMVTGQGDELIAAEAMKRGSSDYIPKAEVTAETIRRAIEKFRGESNPCCGPWRSSVRSWKFSPACWCMISRRRF